MSVLYLDTAVLRGSVSTAEKANDAITEAATYLNQVVVHNDWACSERTQINENTVTNRQTAQEIQENSAAFYQAISEASAEFDEVEQNNITNINGVDDIIGQITSVVQGISGVSSAAGISDFDSILESLEV